MLNELNEVKALLNGERLNKKYTYRSCYLLAKYYKSQNLDMVQARQEIFKWAKQYDIYITDDLNSIIQKAFGDKHELVSDICVYISDEDIEDINNRFDKYNTKLAAFALLCFAKVHADKNGVFYISMVGLSNWLGIEYSQINRNAIKELLDFKYIEKYTQTSFQKIIKKNKSINQHNSYRINVSHDNIGLYKFYDTNIKIEYSQIFD